MKFQAFGSENGASSPFVDVLHFERRICCERSVPTSMFAALHYMHQYNTQFSVSARATCSGFLPHGIAENELKKASDSPAMQSKFPGRNFCGFLFFSCTLAQLSLTLECQYSLQIYYHAVV